MRRVCSLSLPDATVILRSHHPKDVAYHTFSCPVRRRRRPTPGKPPGSSNDHWSFGIPHRVPVQDRPKGNALSMSRRQEGVKECIYVAEVAQGLPAVVTPAISARRGSSSFGIPRT